ncbi:MULTISPECIES: response regulator transcription factor [Aerococcus]|uniref:response regulator transcription factor n=1 Tax=Aerococcus urinae (strain CCUG 59500 / ACS-120-V-Col10a) TaxID=2976812 RepID=UPI000200E4F1|nr:response regulator transcription factor [Aerococcus sp. Group 1]AEA01873.1 response regulator receiver domain protein [Aerococcus sp. Group 1]MCY3030578.1 response regulator transcription factor [Aerococcus sp. Group 1]MCY3055579.1 response regulator transcription factor [Aerococcus sp. Group 1]MCY3057309.1 response regulator transcription factor [Aerococcus sp. Group 1]MCY3061262.1 response regulator transcription factor [Aerococcus sp. Group 1]
MSKLLIVEDDPMIQAMLGEKLRLENYHFQPAYSATEGLLYIERESFDLILLDLMLPGMTGEEFLSQLRQANDVPVIVLSAKDSILSKVEVLKAGANDYMVKPYDLDELVARIEVQLKNRASVSSTGSEKFSYQGLCLDRLNQTISYQGKEVRLTQRERAILMLLLKYPKRIFTKQEIYEAAWQESYLGDNKTLSVHISNLRKKLKQASDRDWIETIWGLGFRL